MNSNVQNSNNDSEESRNPNIKPIVGSSLEFGLTDLNFKPSGGSSDKPHFPSMMKSNGRYSQISNIVKKD